MDSTRIAGVRGRQILDSRGRPTVEAEVVLRGGARGRAAVPSGASTGRHEAHELRDGDSAVYAGLGVTRAVSNVNGEIAARVAGMDAVDQRALDAALRALDGTQNLRRLGANAVLAVSMAACRTAAAALGQPLYRRIADLAGIAQPLLPLPMVNIFSGGRHARDGLDIQDILMVPLRAGGFAAALQSVAAVRAEADTVLRERGGSTLLADEGGLGLPCADVREALDLLLQCFERCGLEPGRDAAIALDVAATSLVDADGRYHLARAGQRLDSAAMIETVAGWARDYPVVSVEDALDDEDWDHWPALTARLAPAQVVGDDLFVTQPDRIRRGIASGAANSALIKLNQNGTLSGTLEAIATARAAGFSTVISARSGETEDSFLADLAVGTAGGQIKIGSVRNSERTAKYNQLLRIAEDPTLAFASAGVLRPGCTAGLAAGPPAR